MVKTLYSILHRSLDLTYLRPGKGIVKECIKLSKGFSQKSLEPIYF